jgi:hypothetical protein
MGPVRSNRVSFIRVRKLLMTRGSGLWAVAIVNGPIFIRPFRSRLIRRCSVRRKRAKQTRARDLWCGVLLIATTAGVGQISTADFTISPLEAGAVESSGDSRLAIRPTGLMPPLHWISSRASRPGLGASVSFPLLVNPDMSPARRFNACAYATACAFVIATDPDLVMPTAETVPPHPASRPGMSSDRTPATWSLSERPTMRPLSAWHAASYNDAPVARTRPAWCCCDVLARLQASVSGGHPRHIDPCWALEQTSSSP